MLVMWCSKEGYYYEGFDYFTLDVYRNSLVPKTFIQICPKIFTTLKIATFTKPLAKLEHMCYNNQVITR